MLTDRTKTNDNLAAGHRDRLRDRFLDQGDDALADYELLELLLFMAIPRRDTKPLAKTLLAQFGSFSAIMNAPVSELEKVKGLGKTAITALKSVRATAKKLIQEDVIDKPVLNSWQRLLDYCHVSMAHETAEQFRLLFLDKKNVLIADEVQQRGTVDHAPVYPREVVKRALELGATALILVHNHPSGDPTPSQADIDMTNAIMEALAALNIRVHDHLVISKKGHRSFKTMGLL